MVELGNTQNKSVSREWIVVDSIRVCKICVCSTSNVMSSKEVIDTSLESISKSHTTTYIGNPVRSLIPSLRLCSYYQSILRVLQSLPLC